MRLINVRSIFTILYNISDKYLISFIIYHIIFEEANI